MRALLIANWKNKNHLEQRSAIFVTFRLQGKPKSTNTKFRFWVLKKNAIKDICVLAICHINKLNRNEKSHISWCSFNFWPFHMYRIASDYWVLQHSLSLIRLCNFFRNTLIRLRLTVNVLDFSKVNYYLSLVTHSDKT